MGRARGRGRRRIYHVATAKGRKALEAAKTKALELLNEILEEE